MSLDSYIKIMNLILRNMSDEISFEFTENTLRKMIKKKEEMGFGNKTWDEWFQELCDDKSDESVNKKIEKIFEQTTYDKYYDDWIRNFALNLQNICNGRTAKELIPNDNSNLPAIVIGRGPSITKHHHLELLADSKYRGVIVCTDGALKNTLRAGVTPDKFENFYVVTIDTNYSVSEFYRDPIVAKYRNRIKAIVSTTIPKITYDALRESGIEIFWVHALFDYNKGKSSFNYIASIMSKCINPKLGFPAIQTGGNVGTSAWIISWSILKCSPIALIGIDHGYPIETPWEEIDKYHKIPEGINKESAAFKKAYPVIYNPDFNSYCKQDPIFQYYANALKELIPRAPKWVKTVNATEGGAIFGPGIECDTFKSFLEKYEVK